MVESRARWPIALVVLATASVSATPPVSAGSLWKLVFPSSDSAASGPALMQVADFTRSDPDIAGLMFRCGGARLETIVIVLDPLPPRTTGAVSLSAGSDTRTFEASTIPTGAGLLVSFDPRETIDTTWRSQKDLRVAVTAGGKAETAFVSLEGLEPSLASLEGRCPSRK